MTWEEFERYPDDEMHHELIEGEHQVLPPKRAKHSIVGANAIDLLEPLNSHGHVFGLAGYKLSDVTGIQPDVSFLTHERVRAADPDGYFLGAPDLAVEIISPSESARDIERKIALLLAKGSAAVWVIYPDSRAIHIHTPDRKSVALGTDDVITLPAFLPGWELPVARLFG